MAERETESFSVRSAPSRGRGGRQISQHRPTFGGRRCQQVEMELDARAKGLEFALRRGDNRFRKGARVEDQNRAALPGHVADGGQQHSVAKRGALKRRIDGEDIATAR